MARTVGKDDVDGSAKREPETLVPERSDQLTERRPDVDDAEVGEDVGEEAVDVVDLAGAGAPEKLGYTRVRSGDDRDEEGLA